MFIVYSVQSKKELEICEKCPQSSNQNDNLSLRKSKNTLNNFHSVQSGKDCRWIGNELSPQINNDNQTL